MDLKAPISFSEQVHQLESHNIIVADTEQAERILKQIGYYRLSGYALQFRKGSSDSDCIDGTTFESIYKIYLFDQDLRQILRRYIEIAEVYYKTLIANIFSLIKCKNPPHDQHYNPNNYYDTNGFHEIFNNFETEKKQYYKDSLIVKHHKNKYGGRMPLWVILELLSFSDASKLYNAMYDSEQKAIADKVSVSTMTLSSHLHCLSVLRNKCAHGARLYNTKMSPPVHMAENYKKMHPEVKNDTVFAYIRTLVARMPNNTLKEELATDLDKLISRYHDYIDLDLIGFPQNYSALLHYSNKKKA